MRSGAAAGVLIGPINYVQVLMGIGVLIKAFAAAVVGGFGSLPGAVLGGLLVGVTESLGAGYVSGTYKDIYAFVLMILVLMVKPSGCSASRRRSRPDLRASRAPGTGQQSSAHTRRTQSFRAVRSRPSSRPSSWTGCRRLSARIAFGELAVQASCLE